MKHNKARQQIEQMVNRINCKERTRYEATYHQGRGTLCALIKDSVGVPSCWDERGFPNALTDKGGRIIRIPSRGGQHITLVDGCIWIGIDCIELNKNDENFVRLVENN